MVAIYKYVYTEYGIVNMLQYCFPCVLCLLRLSDNDYLIDMLYVHTLKDDTTNKKCHYKEIYVYV